MRRFAFVLPVVLVLLAATLPLHAQDGCVDSPENPTAVLGLIVGAASFGFVQIRNRISARRNSKTK